MDKLPLDWADIKGMTARIARDIAITNWRPDYVVGLTRGGLIPAVLFTVNVAVLVAAAVVFKIKVVAPVNVKLVPVGA